MPIFNPLRNGEMTLLSSLQQNRALNLLSQGYSHRNIAREIGSCKSTVQRFLSRRTDRKPDLQLPSIVDTSGESFRENADGSAESSSITDKPIKTLDDAIKIACVDTSVWRVDRWECVQWTVGMKKKNGKDQPESIVQTQQYRVKLYLRRIVPRAIGEAHDLLFKRYMNHKIDYSKLPALQPRKGEPFACVVGLFDVHFGKLCWGDETGKNYDLKIAERVYSNAIEDIIADALHRNVGRFILPIGNDMFHIDNKHNTTFAGTIQDVDGRYAQMIDVVEMAVIRGVEKLISWAPVDVVHVPGNHDPTVSLHLARTVAAWFRSTKRVSVDYSPSPRKYVRYGTNLIGLTHGNEEKHAELPLLMSTEKPIDWADTTCREWLLGHEHRSKMIVTRPVNTFTGVTVRVLKSLASPDSWHHRKGYVGGTQSAEAYFYGRDRGYAGHSVVNARLD